MSKAVLVVDMPESCDKCQLVRMQQNNFICIPKQQDGKSFCSVFNNVMNNTKPDWCPLKLLPEKREASYGLCRYDSAGQLEEYGRAVDSVAVGFNQCIDEILGGVTP